MREGDAVAIAWLFDMATDPSVATAFDVELAVDIPTRGLSRSKICGRVIE